MTTEPQGYEFRDGIFFGMPEEQYHAIPALSASGIKNLRISPLDFWARSRWLNAAYEEDTEGEDSFAKTLGRAFHARIIEGSEVFDTRFAIQLEPGEGVLKTDDELKGWLVDHELPTTGKRKQERIDRILAADPTAKIWDVILDGYEKQHQGKTFLPAKIMDKIELAAAMIEKHPDLSKAFKGGMPEVVICWRDGTHGVPCKIRIDYLKPKAIVDLKTLANMQGLPLRNAIAREIGYRKYHIQSALYLEGGKEIKRLMEAGKVYGDAPHDFLSGLFAGHDKTFLWVFQMKGPAPAALGYTLPEASNLLSIANAEVDGAKQLYRQCIETFGNDPWVHVSQIAALDDADVPPWALI